MNTFTRTGHVTILAFISFTIGCGGGVSSIGNPAPSQNPIPAIVSISPSSITAGSADTAAIITGSGFITGSSVQWNGQSISTTYNSGSTLTATIPASSLTTGTIGKVTVVNPAPGGGTSAAFSFSVNNPIPMIGSVSPTSVTAGVGDIALDIKGSNFVASTVAEWNGAGLLTTFIGANELKATVPAGNLSGSSQSQVTVQTPPPGGGNSASIAFAVNSPPTAITSISPRTVALATAATITIVGTGFESNSVVLWNGSAKPTTFVSPTELQVALSAADLQNQGSGSLAVSNPAPAASTSPPMQLAVTNLPIPAIQSVSIVGARSPFSACNQLQVTARGQNFASNATLEVNGTSLSFVSRSGSTLLLGYLPLGFSSDPGHLVLTVTNPSQGPVISEDFSYPATNPPVMTLCATPSSTTIYPATSFAITAQPSVVNASGNGSLTLDALPPGITAASLTVALPLTGATIHLQAANSIAAGSYDLTMSATLGSAVAQGDFKFTVNTGAIPTIGFSAPINNELGVPIGGSGSIQFASFVSSSSSTDFDVAASATGLPPGTTASFSPNPFLPGQTVTVTLTASPSAPVTQNATVTLTGTPSAPIANATASFLTDVTQPPGSLPGSRTDLVVTGGTPLAATYDATHNLIFASNPDWNRVDVISNSTHRVIKEISIRSPWGLDITSDNSRIWVQTTTANIYEIDTGTLQARHHFLPAASPNSFANNRLLALADGTVFLYFGSFQGSSSTALVWNPQTNQVRNLGGCVFPVRSGDGTHVYATNGSGSSVIVYTAGSLSFTTIGPAPDFSNVAAVNRDGSKLVVGRSSWGLYDHNMNLLGMLPGTLPGNVGSPLQGGAIFSPDDRLLYEIANYRLTDVITIDAATLQIVGVAPAAPIEPIFTSGFPATATPFAVDSSGMVLGMQNFGISFEDSTFYQNYALTEPTHERMFAFDSPPAGPLSGGAVSGLSVFTTLTPDIWFGTKRSAIQSISETIATLSAPPATSAGPVNLKFIYPDGQQWIYPNYFTYSTAPQYAITSGSAPEGGAAAQIEGYGLPQDASSGSVTVGPNLATIPSSLRTQPLYSGEPYPSTVLTYTLPAGSPGWADVQVSTPNGVGTLPKSVFYARSVTSYSTPDSLTTILVDEKRKRLYLSAGDHVDVFSTESNQFLAPLSPAAIGTTKLFTGMALTPDGSQLLVGDIADGSLAVINPDTPSSTFAIPIISVPAGGGGCAIGPLYVAASSTNLAFVTTGGQPGPSCAQAGFLYVVNLQTRSVAPSAACPNGLAAEASNDGSIVAIGDGPCVYVSQSAGYIKATFPYGGVGIALSADGNAIASNQFFSDPSLNMLGSIANPIALYGPPFGLKVSNLFLRPRLNASGSLYYLAYSDYLEIIDVAHALLRMRFALNETVQYTLAPMAIDSGGRLIYLLTNRGLTIVDLGSAPLSVGHLNPQSGPPGSQVVVRGSGFDSGTMATVGGLAAAVSVSDENTLTLSVPTAPSGPQDLVLTREDGETYTLENGIVIP